MTPPTMHKPRWIDSEIAVLPSWLSVPGAGRLPVNSAVLKARQPVLIDTGLAAVREGFLSALEEVIDPTDLRWIWITHTDADHVGNLVQVLERAPEARVVTNFVGLAKMGLLGLPTDRILLLNPGQTLDLGDRKLVALRPPVYDAPETTGAFEPGSRTLFSADSFGALLEETADDARDIEDEALRAGLLGWSGVDAPWLHDIDPSRFRSTLDSVGALGVERIVSAHLPPAAGMMDTLIKHLADAPGRDPFVGPDQAAFEALLAGMGA